MRIRTSINTRFAFSFLKNRKNRLFPFLGRLCPSGSHYALRPEPLQRSLLGLLQPILSFLLPNLSECGQ